MEREWHEDGERVEKAEESFWTGLAASDSGKDKSPGDEARKGNFQIDIVSAWLPEN